MSGPDCEECGEHFTCCACIKERPNESDVDSALFEMRHFVGLFYDDNKSNDYFNLVKFFDQRLLTVQNWWKHYKEGTNG